MNRLRTLAVALAASTAVGGVAFAADQPAAPHETAAQKTADHDVGKLSADGAQAFRDLHQARIAIFEADPTQAKSLIGKAQSELSKAKSDEAVFVKAEADLKSPAALSAATGSKAKADTGTAANGASMAKKVAWLPIDGQLSLGEDFVATPQKAAAVAEANKTLAKGDQKGAMDKLKLADIDVNYTMAVMPLATTTSDVDQAAQLIDQGKYYEANAVLKQAEDGMRFDMIDAVGAPQKMTPPATADAAKPAAAGTAKPAH